jgi:Mn-dependent DtxR family transcriptional regulator
MHRMLHRSDMGKPTPRERDFLLELRSEENEPPAEALRRLGVRMTLRLDSIRALLARCRRAGWVERGRGDYRLTKKGRAAI